MEMIKLERILFILFGIFFTIKIIDSMRRMNFFTCHEFFRPIFMDLSHYSSINPCVTIPSQPQVSSAPLFVI